MTARKLRRGPRRSRTLDRGERDGHRSHASFVMRRMTAVAAALGIAMSALAPPERAAAASPPANVEAYSAWYAEQVVARTYRTMFGRAPSASERAYWTWQVLHHRTSVFLAGRLMTTTAYRTGLGSLSNRAFVESALRKASGSAPADVVTTWTELLNSRSKTRSRFLGWVVEVRFAPALGVPVRTVRTCAQFNRGGPRAVCMKGTAGHQRNVSVVQVPNTNIYVNRAWYYSFASFVAEARKKGWTLSATRDKAVPSWMFAPGSWRSYDEQNWLYTHGYPANPPGRSMHEWGLAVDLNCNGKYITDVPSCWSWVRSNASRFGVRMFHRVDSIKDSEAWHVSSNAY